MIKHSGDLRTLEKCRKHSPAARVFYISLVLSNARRVLSQSNTQLRPLYLLNNMTVVVTISHGHGHGHGHSHGYDHDHGQGHGPGFGMIIVTFTVIGMAWSLSWSRL